MANCGATGSALDQAVSGILSGNGSSGSKTVISNVLGGSSMAMAQQLPRTAPQSLPVLSPAAVVLPQQQQLTSTPVTTAHSVHRPSHGVMSQHKQLSQHSQPLPSQMMPTPHPRMQAIPATPHHQMMMMQQQQAMMQQMIQQRQQLQQQTASPQQVVDTPAPAATIAELSQAWKEATAATEDPMEAPPQGATIEQLSDAWRKVQDEANTSLEEAFAEMSEEDYFSSWAADGVEQYEFRHVMAGGDATDRQPPPEPHDWMAQGMREFAQGNIPQAIRAFEYELQSNNPNSSSAWRMLGRCHAESDMDRDAILCLEQAVERDPYNVEARLALGVSYVNELDHGKALEQLQAWISHNPQLAGLDLSEAADIYGSATAAQSEHSNSANAALEDAQRLLTRALDYSGANGEVVADILEALGVVHNVSRDYEAAVHALERACRHRPNDYQMWNKLGATLANSGQSDKALHAYQRALEIKPKYARAWLNKAISHSNLDQYDQAAQSYLQTLSLNPNALHCWSYLRIAVSRMERWDLIPLIAANDLQALHQHFDFELYTQ